MAESMTISEVSRSFNVSTRLLRYYEQIGLLLRLHKEDYAYRVYDEDAVRRLQQIIILRKLRIPLKQIALIFKDNEHKRMVEVFQESIAELEDEITALSTIRDLLRKFASLLNESLCADIRFDLLRDTDLISVVDALSLSKINFKEERSMDELNKANENISKIRDREVRIVYLPPVTVMASGYIHYDPDNTTRKLYDNFICDTKLHVIKPDIRYFDYIRPKPAKQQRIWV
jgi:Predicted transcriptional regulators